MKKKGWRVCITFRDKNGLIEFFTFTSTSLEAVFYELLNVKSDVVRYEIFDITDDFNSHIMEV